ncbi:unnamed protein product [Amoebophrya sp. A120]|nr:unnamed protein product [Amoebophrya sp. A120]|eukprot:GSA120T00000679001.1
MSVTTRVDEKNENEKLPEATTPSQRATARECTASSVAVGGKKMAELAAGAPGTTATSTTSKQKNRRSGTTSANNASSSKPFLSTAKIWVILCGLICLGTVNFVLLKVVYTEYANVAVGTTSQNGVPVPATTVDLSFFANQGINFLYIVFGGCILYPQMILRPESIQINTGATTDVDLKPLQLLQNLGSTAAVPNKKNTSYRSLQWKFLVMGFLDACGTFLTSLGAGGTPGSLQPLLNQTLIPCTMLISYVALGSWYTRGEIVGAGMIVIGAVFSVSFAHSTTTPASESDSRYGINFRGEEADSPAPPALLEQGSTSAGNSGAVTPAILAYALSTLPMACSSVYKERSFRQQKINVWYLTQWVSIYQFFLTFLFLPLTNYYAMMSSPSTSSTLVGHDSAGLDKNGLLSTPSAGGASSSTTPEGVDNLPSASTSTEWGSLSLGLQCFDGELAFCAQHSLGLALCLYTLVNVLFNTLGLYLTKHGSAVLNSLAYSILLPITTLFYFTPFAPAITKQSFDFATCFVLIPSLVLVLCGFAVFRLYGEAVNAEMAEKNRQLEAASTLAAAADPYYGGYSIFGDNLGPTPFISAEQLQLGPPPFHVLQDHLAVDQNGAQPLLEQQQLPGAAAMVHPQVVPPHPHLLHQDAVQLAPPDLLDILRQTGPPHWTYKSKDSAGNFSAGGGQGGSPSEVLTDQNHTPRGEPFEEHVVLRGGPGPGAAGAAPFLQQHPPPGATLQEMDENHTAGGDAQHLHPQPVVSQAGRTRYFNIAGGGIGGTTRAGQLLHPAVVDVRGQMIHPEGRENDLQQALLQEFHPGGPRPREVAGAFQPPQQRRRDDREVAHQRPEDLDQVVIQRPRGGQQVVNQDQRMQEQEVLVDHETTLVRQHRRRGPGQLNLAREEFLQAQRDGAVILPGVEQQQAMQQGPPAANANLFPGGQAALPPRYEIVGEFLPVEGPPAEVEERAVPEQQENVVVNNYRVGQVQPAPAPQQGTGTGSSSSSASSTTQQAGATTSVRARSIRGPASRFDTRTGWNPAQELLLPTLNEGEVLDEDNVSQNPAQSDALLNTSSSSTLFDILSAKTSKNTAPGGGLYPPPGSSSYNFPGGAGGDSFVNSPPEQGNVSFAFSNSTGREQDSGTTVSSPEDFAAHYGHDQRGSRSSFTEDQPPSLADFISVLEDYTKQELRRLCNFLYDCCAGAVAGLCEKQADDNYDDQTAAGTLSTCSPTRRRLSSGILGRSLLATSSSSTAAASNQFADHYDRDLSHTGEPVYTLTDVILCAQKLLLQQASSGKVVPRRPRNKRKTAGENQRAAEDDDADAPFYGTSSNRPNPFSLAEHQSSADLAQQSQPSFQERLLGGVVPLFRLPRSSDGAPTQDDLSLLLAEPSPPGATFAQTVQLPLLAGLQQGRL